MKEYTALLEKIKIAFQNEFVTTNGRLSSNTQTAYSLALSFNLLPDSTSILAAERLANDVRSFGHITTGFIGTPLICHVLTKYGYLDEAYMLLNRTKYPSWLYPVTKGATTIWERWDGLKPDGTFQDVGMNSFNHYAYGAIGEWLYQVVAGLDLDEGNLGYRNIIFHPHPGGGLSHANASLHSIYGPVESAWQIDGDQFTYNTTIPPNTMATIYLPKAKQIYVLENGKSLSDVKGIKQINQEDDMLVIQVGSGSYSWVYLWTDTNEKKE